MMSVKPEIVPGFTVDSFNEAPDVEVLELSAEFPPEEVTGVLKFPNVVLLPLRFRRSWLVALVSVPFEVEILERPV